MWGNAARRATCELTGNRVGHFTDVMRFLMVGVFIGMLAGAGCFHRKAAAPKEDFTDIPGLPKTPEPVPVEAKQKPKPQKKEVKAKVNPTPVADADREKKGATRTRIEDHPAQVAVPTSAEPKSSTQKLIVTPENGLVGKVEMVNQNARYVVLSFPIGHLPAMEQRLSVYRNGLKVGEVKVSGPQIEDNVVADIVQGDSGPGDEVRDK